MTGCFTHRLFAVVRVAAVILASMLVGAPTARAQEGSIFGQVTDVHGEPIPSAHVVLRGTASGDAASLEGTYRIEGIPAGTYLAEASAVGFASDTVRVGVHGGQAVRVDFRLESAMLETGEVVVTAARHAQATGGVAASVSTLSAREIEMRHTVALDDALRYVSGVQMAGNQVSIRGSSGFSYNTGSRVLLLLDGMPMLRPDADGIPFDAVPMQQVQRIEVLKGPGSALYGGGALGGIIHVLTRSYPDTAETFVVAYGGAYEPVRYDVWRRRWAGADTPRPLGGLTLGHGRPLGERTGIWANVTFRYDAGHLNGSRRRSLQTFARFSFRPSSDARIDVLAGGNRRTSDSFLFWNGARDALNPGRIELGRSTVGIGSDDNLVNEISLQPSYTELVGANLFVSARARLLGVFIQALDDEGKPKPLSDGTVGFRYGGELQLDYEPADGRRFIAGLTGDANAARSGFFNTGDRLSQPEGAVFGQWEERIGRRVDVSGGLRFDTYRIRAGMVERKLSPRASASITLASAWSLRLAYGEGFRVPSVAERFIDNSDYLPVVSNLALQPETSRSYEVGLRRAPPVHQGALVVHVDASAFWSDYWRLVEPTFVPSERAFQFTNLTRARVRGAELMLDAATPTERTSIRAGYTFLDARDLTVDQPLVFRSRHLLKAGATAMLGPLEVGADLRLASEPERVDSDFARFVRDAEVAGPTRVMDVRVGTSWRSVRTTLHVKNALDYYYIERPALLAPPRHVVVQLSAKL